LATFFKKMPDATLEQGSVGATQGSSGARVTPARAPRTAARDVLMATAHSCRMLLLTLMTALVGAVVIVWPVTLVVLKGAESLAVRNVSTPSATAPALNPFSWPEDLSVDRAAMKSVVVARELIAIVMTYVTYGFVLLCALGSEDVWRRRLALALQVLYSLGLFSIGFSLHAAAIDGSLALPSPTMAPLIRAACNIALNVSVQTISLLLPFPRSDWWRLRWHVVRVMIVNILCSLIWRTVCTSYFAIQSSLVRVALGVAVPQVFHVVGFECYYGYAVELLGSCGFVPAVLFLTIPMFYGIGVAATLQQGAVDLTSGIAMEVCGIVVELMGKRAMLCGQTPWAQTIRNVKSMCCCCCRRATSPRVTPTELKVKGVMPDGGPALGPEDIPTIPGETFTRLSCAGAPSEQAVAAVSDRCTIASCETAKVSTLSYEVYGSWQLLLAVALISNIAELIVHVTVSAYYVLAKLNPNESGAPPIPAARILVLISIKVVCELFGDILQTMAVSRMCRQSRARLAFLEGLWNVLGWRATVLLCVAAFAWAIETQTYFAFNSCPYGEMTASGQAKLLSLGMCMSSSERR